MAARIKNDFRALEKEGEEFETFFFDFGDDGDTLEGYICGPEGTPYEGGTFNTIICFSGYPKNCPSVKITTKVFHPAVSLDDGHMCLGSFMDAWNEACNFQTVVHQAQAILSSPCAESGVNHDACALLQSSPEAFNAKAKEWTEKFAMEDE